MSRFVWGFVCAIALVAALTNGFSITASSQGPNKVVEIVRNRDSFVTRTHNAFLRKPPKPEKTDGTVVATQRFVSPFLPHDDAWNDALDKARAWVSDELQLARQPDREFMTRRNLIKAEEEPGPVVEGTKTYRITMNVELTRGAERELLQANRAISSQDRIGWATRAIALMTSILGGWAAFVRIDDWTKGYYSKRLGAALSILVATAAVFIATI